MKLRPAGERGLLVELDDLETVHRLHAALRDLDPPGVVELVPGYRTLLVVAGPGSAGALDELAAGLPGLELPPAGEVAGEPVEVPVSYDGEDLPEVASLTGLDAEENQARQLLNDLDAYRAESDLTDEQQAAHRWLTEVFEPVVRAVPANLRRKLEPQEIFSQIIQHKWLLSEQAGRDIGMAPAVQSYLTEVLVHRPDEQAVLGIDLTAAEPAI